MFRQDSIEIADFSMLGDRFKDAGCGICSGLHIIEQVKNSYFSPRKVQVMCFDLHSLEIIDKDFYMKSWERFFSFFGMPSNVRFEGADYICQDGEEEIILLVKPGYGHLVAGDGKGNYSFDSLGRRDAQKDYTIKDKRIITPH